MDRLQGSHGIIFYVWIECWIGLVADMDVDLVIFCIIDACCKRVSAATAKAVNKEEY